MSGRRHRRGSEDSNISFLDVICCGFGAIVLLLVIVKPTEPIVLEESQIQQKGQVRSLQERLFEIRGQVKYLETELNAKHEQLGIDQRRVAILRSEFEQLNSRKPSVEEFSSEDSTSALDLQIALQTLTREMKRLLTKRKKANDYIAGVPVDSEYIIFVIDTSGSMTDQGYWGLVLRQVDNVLRIYPKVKGIQVLNNMGQYMFGRTRGEWLPDTPSRRRAILQKLAVWRAGSASNPVPGIIQAINRYYDKNKKISLYVFGDDYPGRSIRRVLRHVNELNKKNSQGESMVRIHTVGFPVHLRGKPGISSGAMRYASLMRELAEQNDGVFIGTSNVN